YRSLRQTLKSWPPALTFHTCGAFISSSASWNFWLIDIRLSRLPQEIHSSFSRLTSFGSGTSSDADFVFGAEEKPPTQANVSILCRPKFNDWPPPIDSPASARFCRFASTE